MTTEDVVSARTSASRARRATLKAAAVAITGALALSACGAPDGFVDGWWDNGDPIYAPHKADLFDEAGDAVCTAPTVARTFESRARTLTTNGGVLNSFFFEVINPELDPNEELIGFETAAEERAERLRRERRLGSLERMYQYTHPAFDAKYGIDGPEDMQAIKDELASHLDGLDEAPLQFFAKPGDQWLETPEGRFNVRRITAVDIYIEENNIDATFNGLAFTYMRANLQGGDEFLMITNKETGETVLKNANEEIPIGEESELFVEFTIDMTDPPDEQPEAIVTLANDQCTPYFGDNTARYWIYDYELLFPEEREPVELI